MEPQKRIDRGVCPGLEPGEVPRTVLGKPEVVVLELTAVRTLVEVRKEVLFSVYILETVLLKQ